MSEGGLFPACLHLLLPPQIPAAVEVHAHAEADYQAAAEADAEAEAAVADSDAEVGQVLQLWKQVGFH